MALTACLWPAVVGPEAAFAAAPLSTGIDDAKATPLPPGAGAGAAAAVAAAQATASQSGAAAALQQCSGAAKVAAAQTAKTLGAAADHSLVAAAAEQALADCKQDALANEAAASSLGLNNGPQVQTLIARTCMPEPSGCTGGGQFHCTNDGVTSVIRTTFSVAAGLPLRVHTDGLLPTPGADTVLYVLRCDSAACTAGTIVGIDDDGNTDTASPEDRDSLVSLIAPQAGTYMAVAVAYSTVTGGAARLHAVQNGTDLLAPAYEFAWPFGGWSISCTELRTADSLWIAKNPTGPSSPGDPEYHDSTALVLSTSARNCAADCGQFQFADDTVYGPGATTWATRMTVSAALGNPTEARIIVAPYHAGATMRGRFLHQRRHTASGGGWAGDDQLDRDSDGLTHEVERELHTCDVPDGWDSTSQAGLDTGADVGFIAANCARYAARVDQWLMAEIQTLSCPGHPDCWRGRDSDNDGLGDAQEVFAAPIQCAHSPSGPYRDAGTCTPLGIDSACAPGSWCLVEPLPARAGADPAAPQGPNPTVFDLYVEQDFYEKAAANMAFAEATGQHRLTNAPQRDLLRSVFSTMPGRCWDGSTPAGACSVADDLRYRTALHLYHGAGTNVGDDRFQENLPTSSGARFARSHWYGRFGSDVSGGRAFRYGGLGRYGLAWHGPATSGESEDFGARLLWYGDSLSDQAGAANLAHEFGHTVTLVHPHGAGLLCPASGTPETDTTCRYDAPPSSAGQDCASVRSAQLPVASLMSYDYLFGVGMLPLATTAPNANALTFTGCSVANLRFSKGLNPVLDEASLKERMTPGVDGPAWQLAKLAQDLFCFDGFNDQVAAASQFSFYGANMAQGNRRGPGFDGADYVFNWDSSADSNATTGSTAYDASGGRTKLGNAVCDQDELSDTNEWGRIFALSRRSLSANPGREMCLYGDTFNGTLASGPGFFGDFCGWGEAMVLQGMATARVPYPYFGCVLSQGSPVGCAPGMACQFDVCDASLQGCRLGAGACSDGQCACFADSDCYSGQCVAGRCVTGWGGCGCSLDSDCAGGDCDSDFCVTTMPAELAYSANPPNGNEPAPLLESATFNGINSRIELPSSVDSRLETVSGSYQNGFTWMIDLRHDGFDGETAQTVLHAGAFNLTKTATGLTVTLDNGQTALTYPPHGGEALQRGRWYRIVWSAKPGTQGAPGEHFLWVRPWDPLNGGYLPGDSAANCVRRDSIGSLASTGTVWLGHDGSTDASRYFKGRLDNVSLVNYVHVARPQLCTDQP